ncbi:carboxypeptidase Y-deficient [Coemansia sp. RSA 2526]|nr:carboxypeptidase Y-deficient [Coemansia sp. RSA 2526]
MSHTSLPSASPLRKEASLRHVRRAARTLGPAPDSGASESIKSASESTESATRSIAGSPESISKQPWPASPQQITRAARSQSTSESGVYEANSNARRSTISLGALQTPLSNNNNSNNSSRRTSGAFGESPTVDALRCPICGVVAPSLFALNVHLDDTHFGGEGAAEGPRYAAQDDLEEVKGAIMGFFRGAGRAVRGLGSVAQGGVAQGGVAQNDIVQRDIAETRLSGNGWSVGERDGADRGLVSCAHWQQHRAGARCGEPACGTVLSAQSGIANCRSCGRLMCLQHCARRLRLSATAQASRRGEQCRVCDDCVGRATGVGGQTRDHTRSFAHLRRKTVTAAVMEGNRVEKRLEKLAVVHGNWRQTPAPLVQTAARSRALQDAEQTVVVWQDDADAPNCLFCERVFGRLSTRRHHCRLCGRVVCGRPQCSAQLSVPLPLSDAQGFSTSECADIRVCRECEHVVVRHRDRIVRAAPQAPELMQLYALIRTRMSQVEETLPVFNTLAMRLHSQVGSAPPDLPRAARIRKQLTAAFSEMDQASKRIVALPSASTGHKRLHAAIRRMVAQYLQLHMFPLTMLPTPPRRPSSAMSMSHGPRAPTPLRMQATVANGELTESPSASLPSSISTINIDAALPILRSSTSTSDAGSASMDASTANGSNRSPTRVLATQTSPKPPKSAAQAVGGAAAGLASSLLSYVIPAKPKPEVENNIHEELIMHALAADPSKAQRIAAMAVDEKMASLDVLRDQRQRVLGYISEAQKDRRLEDAMSLQTSLNDLDIELSLIERSL